MPVPHRAMRPSTRQRLISATEGAVASNDLPFVVAMASRRNGILWEGAAGMSSASRPAGPETVFRIFSMGKALASLAVVLLIDRGILTLDTPVAAIIPEFADIQVLVRIQSGQPILRPPRSPVTVRHLLTHTSGLTTPNFCPKQRAWMTATGAPSIHSGTRASLFYPLMFDPGDQFAYGIGIDWAGRVIEHIDGRLVDEFCTDEIFEPLGMHHTAFEGPETDGVLADLKMRDPDGAFRDYSFPVPPPHPEVYNMGSAVYSTAPDYLRFLQFVLNGGQWYGRRLVSERAMTLMLTNQLGNLSVPVLRSTSAASADVDLFPGMRKTWTIGFMRNEAGIPGRRSAGSLGWAGSANTHYWIDPLKGLAAVYMTQAFPFCDGRIMRAFEDFEEAVYELQ
jgi:methyl acetate hydrolase